MTSEPDNRASFSVSRRTKRFAFLVVAIFLGLCAAIFTGELLVRLVAPQNLTGSWTELSDRGYYINRADALVQHQLGERVVTYRFNVHRLRGGPVDFSLPRVLMLGDSYTFGYLVREEDTFISHLQDFADRLFRRRVQFLNGGAPGWGTASYLAFLEEFGATLAPDAVVVFLNTDDLGRSLKSQMYVPASGDSLRLTFHQNRLKIAPFKRFVNRLPGYHWLLEHSHLLQLVRNAYVRWHQNRHGHARFEDMVIPASGDLRIQPHEARRYGRALFRRMRDWCAAHDARLLVLTTGFHTAPETDGVVDPTAAFIRQAARIFREEGIPFKDLTPEVLPVVLSAPQTYFIPEDGHPNSATHRLIAEKAWPWLRLWLERWYGPASGD